jgi:hypothetical protein
VCSTAGAHAHAHTSTPAHTNPHTSPHTQEYTSFYCRAHDPWYIKKLKMESLSAIASSSNVYVNRQRASFFLLPATFLPPSCHLPTTFLPPSCHLPATFQPPSHHLPRYEIVNELTEYTRDASPAIGREAVRAVGRIALTVRHGPTA